MKLQQVTRRQVVTEGKGSIAGRGPRDTLARGNPRGVGAALGGAVLLIGCGGDPKPVMRCPIGDVSSPAELQILHLDANFSVIETQPMAEVPLLPAPQGGWLVLLGVRAKNIDGCHATLKTALVSTCDNQILQVDSRPTHLDMGADGWGVSSLTTFGNLPVCPDHTATRDLYNVPHNVIVSIEDTDGQKATASLTVVPTCASDAPLCLCECDRDYVDDNHCPVIGGPHATCGAH
jgi:hypothetical protein